MVLHGGLRCVCCGGDVTGGEAVRRQEGAHVKGVRSRRLGLALIVALMLAAIAPAVHASCTDCYDPDFRIRLLGGVLKGDDIYNTTAVGQTVNALTKVGKTRQIVLSIQNDGEYSSSYRVSLASVNGNLSNFTATYMTGWVSPSDITFAIQTANFTTPSLAPGQVYYFRVYVDVLNTASPGQYTGATLNVTEAAYSYQNDRVTWKVTAN